MLMTVFCRISLENISTIWQFANENGAVQLRSACLSLAKTDFEQFVVDGKFIGSLSVEEFQGILSNPWLCVSDRYLVFTPDG